MHHLILNMNNYGKVLTNMIKIALNKKLNLLIDGIFIMILFMLLSQFKIKNQKLKRSVKEKISNNLSKENN